MFAGKEKGSMLFMMVIMLNNYEKMNIMLMMQQKWSGAETELSVQVQPQTRCGASQSAALVYICGRMGSY